jgi:hypothetical protein
MDIDVGATSLPPWMLYPSTVALALIFLVVAFFRTRNPRAKLALFVPWFRYLMTFFHDVTFKPAAAGLSYMALLSSAMFVIGLLLVKRRHLLLKPAIPIYLVIAVVLISGAANHVIGGTIDISIKFGYLLVVGLLVYESLGEVGEQRMTRLLLWPFIMPFTFLALSLLLGVKKASEADGSVSYIGGYSHESGFSMVLATCFLISCFATDLNRVVRNTIQFACIAGILLANYRTTILGITPLLLAVVNRELLMPFPPKQRRFLLVVTLVVSAVGIALVAYLMRERFIDMAGAFEPWDRLLKRPEDYNEADRALFNGRAFIWSGYVTGWVDGTTVNHLFGFGANSWQGVFPIYAHNTLISTLYEYGPPGVLAVILLWASMLRLAMRARHGPKMILIAGHLSFLIMNMATMPHWMIEGDILYGILVGYTMHFALRPAPTTARPAVKTARRSALGAPEPALAQRLSRDLSTEHPARG